MKKRLNIIFFSLCFIASIIIEAYFLQAEKTDIPSIAGMGIVVLITGYLLLDSLRSRLDDGTKALKAYVDQMIQKHLEHANEHYTELNNLQKANYTATKKNTVLISGQLADTMNRLDKMEEKTSKALYKIAELQKKSLEGQKNALNYEINYNKENTRQLIKVLREENNRTEVSDLMARLLESMNRNNELLEAQLNKLNSMSLENVYIREADGEKSFSRAFEEQDNHQLDSLRNTDREEIPEEAEWPQETADNFPGIAWEDDEEAKEEFPMMTSDEAYVSFPETPAETTEEAVEEVAAAIEMGEAGNIEVEAGNVGSAAVEASSEESWLSDVNDELNNLMSGWSFESESEDVTEKAEAESENYAPDTLTSIEEEPVSEAPIQIDDFIMDTEMETVDNSEVTNATETASIETDSTEATSTEAVSEEKESAPEITPIYSDPNKALSADEIAALFASFGQ